jgi:hypothetical protein
MHGHVAAATVPESGDGLPVPHGLLYGARGASRGVCGGRGAPRGQPGAGGQASGADAGAAAQGARALPQRRRVRRLRAMGPLAGVDWGIFLSSKAKRKWSFKQK